MKIPPYLLIYHEVKVTVLTTTSPKSEEIQDWLVIGGVGGVGLTFDSENTKYLLKPQPE